MAAQPAPSAVVTPDAVAEALDLLRAGAPLVHCLTNIVVAGFTANALLAAGASPAMADAVEDARLLARGADGVLVNLGTVTPASFEGMRAAVAAVGDVGGRWVLDPVAAGALPWRAGLAEELLDLSPPAVVRANASEVLALTGRLGGRGVEADAGPDEAAEAARLLVDRYGTTVAVSGQVDLVTDGERTVRVHTGHPLMTRVTGVGCVLGALVAGFAAVVEDPLVAAVAATTLLTLAAERAAACSTRPGSFAVALVDELDAIDAAHLRASARLG